MKPIIIAKLIKKDEIIIINSRDNNYNNNKCRRVIIKIDFN